MPHPSSEPTANPLGDRSHDGRPLDDQEMPASPAPWPAAPKLAFVAADTEEARAARERLAVRYHGVPPDRADAVVALGGDGFLLETLHRTLGLGHRVPVY